MHSRNVLMSTASRLRRDDSGSIAIVFALALMPLTVAAGMAVDYGRASNTRTVMSAALDAGVLSAAKNIDLKTDHELKNHIKDYIGAMKADKDVENLQIEMLPASEENRVKAKITGCVKAIFAGVLEKSEFCFVSAAEAERPSDVAYEVSIVLDNSGSMMGSKLQDAKDAAKALVDTLFDNASAPGRMRISVVPFALSVNVGSQYANASWVDLDGQSSIHWENVSKPTWAKNRLEIYKELGVQWNGCFEYRPSVYGASDRPPVTSLPDSMFVPMFAPDEPGERGKSQYYQNNGNHYTGGKEEKVPNSYLNDDGGTKIDYNNKDETKSHNGLCDFDTVFEDHDFHNRQSKNSCRYKINKDSSRLSLAGQNGSERGPNFTCNVQALSRLSSDRNGIKAAVDRMTAWGGTNTLEGFVWGWRTISPNAPFADGKDYTWKEGATKLQKIIVLMTDGDNDGNSWDNPNKSRYNPFGFHTKNHLASGLVSEKDAMDAVNREQKRACANAKLLRNADNKEAIRIYTVGFSTPGKEISTEGLDILKDCASSDGSGKLFFKATDKKQLIDSFKSIANSITALSLKS
jgi:Flp pilus assembly protein TadG